MKQLLGIILISPVITFFLYSFVMSIIAAPVGALCVYGGIGVFILGLYLLRG